MIVMVFFAIWLLTGLISAYLGMRKVKSGEDWMYADLIGIFFFLLVLGPVGLTFLAFDLFT